MAVKTNDFYLIICPNFKLIKP